MELDPATGSMASDRLPQNVVPRHYSLTLEPNWDSFTFEGNVVIDLEDIESASSISFHTLELDLHHILVSSDGTEVTSSPEVSYNATTQITTIQLTNGKSIAAGTFSQLKITFTGQLNDKMTGFYRSTYENEEGETMYVAATQMEAIGCRRAFPCWDEPGLKAEFTVALIADTHLTCLSNMDVTSESEVISSITGLPRQVVNFRKTPAMSTYLVAFAIGQFKSIQTNGFRVPVRLFVPPDHDIEQGRFALDLTARTLALYEKTFAYEYPLPKMDLIVIPDFTSTGMENWGLIMYDEDILVDQESTGPSIMESVGITVQHELAHQWFGNLVTMEWWDGLWLNEGFATWMASYAADLFFPEWKVWHTFAIDLQSTLELDALRSSHPVEVAVRDADDIDQIFDAISYGKGAAVLRMISKYIGEEVFIRGVRNYIKKHAFGNTRTSDLWEALSDASGQPLEKVADTWTRSVGFPVLTVTENRDNTTIHVRQNRFLETGDVKDEDDQTIYPVRLCLRTKHGVDNELLLTEREQDYKIAPNDFEFFKLNAGHSGIFRTAYSAERLVNLSQAAEKGLLPVEDRAGLVSDARALASAGHQGTADLLTLLTSFENETEFLVWQQVLSAIESIQKTWGYQRPDIKLALVSFCRKLVTAKAHDLGWEFEGGENDGHTIHQFKAMMLESAGLSGEDKVISAARHLFERSLNGDLAAIHPAIRGAVYNIVLENGGSKEYEIILERYESASTSDAKIVALRALGHAKDPDLAQKTLSLCIDGSVKPQDIYLVLEGFRHADGIVTRFEWMCNNWEALHNMLGKGQNLLGLVVTACCSDLATREQLKKVESFFNEKDLKGFDRDLDRSLDAIRVKIDWLERDSAEVERWLHANGFVQVEQDEA